MLKVLETFFQIIIVLTPQLMKGECSNFYEPSCEENLVTFMMIDICYYKDSLLWS